MITPRFHSTAAPLPPSTASPADLPPQPSIVTVDQMYALMGRLENSLSEIARAVTPLGAFPRPDHAVFRTPSRPDPDPPDGPTTYTIPDWQRHPPHAQLPVQLNSQQRLPYAASDSFTQPYITNSNFGGHSPNAYPQHTYNSSVYMGPDSYGTPMFSTPELQQPPPRHGTHYGYHPHQQQHGLTRLSPPDRFQQPRLPSYWDSAEVQHPLPAYQQPYHDLPRQPTCWDPPAHRQALSPVPLLYPITGYQDRPSEYYSPKGPNQYVQPALAARQPASPQQLQQAQICAPQAYPAYVLPTPHAADFRQPAAVNVTPLTAVIPPPGSPDIMLDSEEIKNFEDERVRQSLVKTAMSKGSGMPSADYDVDLSEDSPKGVESGLSTSNQHPSTPEAMSMDFLVRHQLKVDPDEVRARANQVVQDKHRTKKNTKLHQFIGPLNDQSDSLHVSVVTSISFHSTTLDADARFIPPRIDTPCLNILNSHINKSPSLVILDGIDEGRCTLIRRAFDPGGDTLMLLLSSLTLFVLSWFPP